MNYKKTSTRAQNDKGTRIRLVYVGARTKCKSNCVHSITRRRRSSPSDSVCRSDRCALNFTDTTMFFCASTYRTACSSPVPAARRVRSLGHLDSKCEICGIPDISWLDLGRTTLCLRRTAPGTAASSTTTTGPSAWVRGKSMTMIGCLFVENTAASSDC